MAKVNKNPKCVVCGYDIEQGEKTIEIDDKLYHEECFLKEDISSKEFEENTLYYYANKYRKHLVNEDEIEKIDMTNIFISELEEMIKRGEIVIININAMMRKGKSTLAMKIGKIIFDLLKKYGHRKKTEKFGMKNIARDHQEHSKMMRDPTTCFTVVVTDESNELEKTGENVTVEKALEQVFSDVQAGRYVHRVCCSPKETVDPNAEIFLDITSIDKETLTTHAKLRFRITEGGQSSMQLLGYVRISVADIINTWDKKAKPIFYDIQKGTATKEQIAQFMEYRKKDWYTEYYVKKHEKMELITKEGIFRPRELDYAETMNKIIGKLKGLTKLGNVLSKEIVKNYVEMQFRTDKIPTSIVGIELSTQRCMGVLNTYKEMYKLVKQINSLKPEDEHKRADLVGLMNTLKESGEFQEAELKRYENINKKYNEDVNDYKLEEGKTGRNK